MSMRRYRNGSHQVRGNARRPFRHARRIQKIANSAAIHYSLLPIPYSDDTATVYYNYRHYEPVMGRWLQRDPIGEDGGVDLYVLVENFVLNFTDKWGLSYAGQICTPYNKDEIEFKKLETEELHKANAIPLGNGKFASGKVTLGDLNIDACCKCVGKSLYKIVLSVKSTCYISIIIYGKNGPKDRTNEGYRRTLRHEELHVAHMISAFNEIVADLTVRGEHSLSKCLEERADIVKGKKYNDAIAKWKDMKQKDYVHSGKDWDDWRKNDGKTESDKELW